MRRALSQFFHVDPGLGTWLCKTTLPENICLATLGQSLPEMYSEPSHPWLGNRLGEVLSIQIVNLGSGPELQTILWCSWLPVLGKDALGFLQSCYLGKDTICQLMHSESFNVLESDLKVVLDRILVSSYFESTVMKHMRNFVTRCNFAQSSSLANKIVPKTERMFLCSVLSHNGLTEEDLQAGYRRENGDHHSW